jgi:hypothetical protein
VTPDATAPHVKFKAAGKMSTNAHCQNIGTSHGCPTKKGKMAQIYAASRHEDLRLITGRGRYTRILALYSSCYNQMRTHLALRKDVPLRRAVQGSGTIVATPILFGLHHRYARI